MSRAVSLGLCLFALPLVVGCPDPESGPLFCASDEQCSEWKGMPDWVCDPDRTCVCDSDAACPVRESCNRRPDGDGRCHPLRFCDSNADCREGEFCDTRTRSCRQSGCELDSQCQPGHVCDRASSWCLQGCRSHGDCLLGSACMCDDGEGGSGPCACDADDEEGRMQCQPGVCEADACGDNSFCPPGQRCRLSTEEGPFQCEEDLRAPYCEPCSLTEGLGFCDGGANFCLFDPFSFAWGGFCGGDCSQGAEGGQSCPAGFVCGEILLPPPEDWDCRSDMDCEAPADAPHCDEDSECPPGAWCREGRCAGKCFGYEGGIVGTACSCVSDGQCSRQSCGSDSRCTTSGSSCATDDDCKGKLACLNDGWIGYCKIGENCVPGPGLTCAEFRDMREQRER